jgi:four helix bundle protein
MPDGPLPEHEADSPPREDADPPTRRHADTSLPRRSSRSVCANLAEAWRKRRYQAAFVSKLNDAETEAAETQVQAEIAFRHGYLNQEIFNEVDDACDKILAQIVKMIDQADRWVIKPRGPSQVSDHLIREQEADSSLREYADPPTRRSADPSHPGGASGA